MEFHATNIIVERKNKRIKIAMQFNSYATVYAKEGNGIKCVNFASNNRSL
jgi:hypothetical protein